MDALAYSFYRTAGGKLLCTAVLLLTVAAAPSQNPVFQKSGVVITALAGSVPPSDSSGGFFPLAAPQPGDWLAEHDEPGQTFDEFLAGPRNEVSGDRSTMYLQPLWNFGKDNGPPLDYLKTFAEIYFCMPVKLCRTLHPPEKDFSMRINHYSCNLQANADRILQYLMKRVPARAYCMLGITMTDLYPDPLWNFVFGYATYKERVGIFSFARYTPVFYDVSNNPDPKLVLLRSCKILAHETGHMFAMVHCTAYRCVMNGCNNLEENDRQPIHLCPVCLKKLQYATSFDVEQRYKALAVFYRAAGFPGEARWIENRIVTFRRETALNSSQ